MKHIKPLGLFLTFFLCSSLYAASWKVFAYMDSSDSLSDMAIKNITDMLRVPKNDSVDFLIQLHAYDTAGLKYQVTKEGLAFIGEAVLTGDSKQDFINAAQWGFANNKSDHTMLVLWNHGWGILDPEWNKVSNNWEALSLSLSHSCPIKRSLADACDIHRGFMFSVTPRTYLNNQGMVDGLSFIKNNVLNGKKLDILAFDTCMGGMLEVMYQAAPYVQYLVGNQVCSLRDGFDYHGIMNILNQGLAPRDMATEMVRVFDNYYTEHDKNGIYAHTALDGFYTEYITKALDDIVTQLLKRQDCAAIALKAHDESPHACLYPMYTDLVSFIKEIEKRLPKDESTVLLKQAMNRFYDLAQKFVVAHCAGYRNLDTAHGCAIYLPSYAIDISYKQTLFGQQTQWIKLLECIEKNAQPLKCFSVR